MYFWQFLEFLLNAMDFIQTHFACNRKEKRNAILSTAYIPYNKACFSTPLREKWSKILKCHKNLIIKISKNNQN